jgi:hypothetical protein
VAHGGFSLMSAVVIPIDAGAGPDRPGSPLTDLSTDLSTALSTDSGLGQSSKGGGVAR